MLRFGGLFNAGSILGLLLVAIGTAAASAQVTATLRSVVALPSTTTDQNGVSFSFAEMSGVTWVKSDTNGSEFVAVTDSGSRMIRFRASFTSDGSISGLQVLPSVTIGLNSDWEGIAFTDPARGMAFLATETGPGIYEGNLSTGQLIRQVSTPAVFANIRSNNGFESLTLHPFKGELWTVNEEALTTDGAVSSQAAGTTVRLLRMVDALGAGPAAAQQYAYVTAPWHGAAVSGARSGVCDLAVLPSGKLLVLERSLAASLTPFKNQIFLANVTAATNVSTLSGLVGQSYTAASKTLVWSGFLGQNLEGLCVGPRLPGSSGGTGKRVLVGVVDSGDSLSQNSVVSWQLSEGAECLGDFDANGAVQVADIFTYLAAWFGGHPWADVDGSSGLTVSDIFALLQAWFSGC